MPSAVPEPPLFDHDPPQRVALVRLRVGLGDLLCGVPALRALRARLPEAHVALVTYPEVQDVVDRMGPWIDELIAFPGHPGIPERPPQGDQAYARFLERAGGFDLALQAYGANPAANAVTSDLRARRTGGFFVTGEGTPDLRTSIPYPHHLHEVDRHLALMAHLGAPAPANTSLELPIRLEEEEQHEALLAETGLQPGRYVLVHPGATSPSRRWPLSRWAEVADALARRGLQPAITGVPSEREDTAALAALTEEPVLDLTGRTSLGSAAALVRDAALLVGNDTGTAHIAAATRTPSVTVFLSGDPVRFGPRGTGPHRIARTQVECNPCHHLACPIDHRCATRTTVEDVLAQADALLRQAVPA